MRYWDTSAIVPLLVHEPRSVDMRAMLKSDERVVTWWGTAVECASALAQLRRRDAITADVHDDSLRRMGKASEGWRIVAPSNLLRFEAMSLLRLHSFRTGDALQLAAALDWVEHRPNSMEFVSLDQRLREAAASQGFRILPA